MMDAAFYWLGALIAALGMIGLTAFLVLWTTDQVVRATGTLSIIAQWYVAKVRREKAERERR